jgi:hypothetical protein
MGEQRRELGALEQSVLGLAAAIRALQPGPPGPRPAADDDDDDDDDIVREPNTPPHPPHTRPARPRAPPARTPTYLPPPFAHPFVHYPTAPNPAARIDPRRGPAPAR